MNVIFNVNEIGNNVQLGRHYSSCAMDIILMPFLLGIFIAPKRLRQSACGMPSGIPDNASREGYRTRFPTKITQNPPPPKPARARENNEAQL